MTTLAGLGSSAEIANLVAGAKDLHKRILFVLMVFVIYRLGTHIPLPGVDAVALAAYQSTLQQGILGMLNMFSGGAFSRMAVFALNIMPYVTASIIVQLFTVASPTLSELQKEGETGRRKITQYTRYLTVALAFAQGFGLAAAISTQTVNVGGQAVALVPHAGLLFNLQTGLVIMTGTLFLMWLGEQINARGIGNGISLLIFAGIVAEMPKTLFQVAELARTGSIGSFALLGFFVLVIATLVLIVFVESAQRRVMVQYPKRGATGMGQSGAETTFMPLKLNMSGVMPPIFASTILFVPIQVSSIFPNAEWAQFLAGHLAHGKPWFIVFYVILIAFFCFFWTANVSLKTTEVADNLKKSGGFIPGIRPGQQTADFLDKLGTRLTLWGAAYLAFVCTLPDVMQLELGVPYYFGGTSLLIMVSVTIDTVTRIQSFLIAQKYESILKKTALRGAKRKG